MIVKNAGEKLYKLNGVFYTQNKLAETFGYHDYTQKVGVLAQEVLSVLPEVVKLAPFDSDVNSESKSGENYLTVQYEKLTALLIEGMKEQQILIDDLTARVVLLESIIKA